MLVRPVVGRDGLSIASRRVAMDLRPSPDPSSAWGEVVISPTTKVRERRDRVGLSQEALARECGVSRQTIVNVEQGKCQPRVLLALDISAALGSTVEALWP
jgi:putative transcriptional regulator